MKLFLEFLPIILFFVAYKMYDIYTATAVAIAASVIQTFYHRYKHGSFEKMHIVTMAMLVVLGGMTIAFQDEAFIKWKPSVVNWVFAAVLIGSFYIGKKPIIQRLLSSQLTLPNDVWGKLNWAWAIFFAGVGFLNIWVAYNFDTDTWVNFKMFGLLGLTIVFIIAQSMYLARYMDTEEEK